MTIRLGLIGTSEWADFMYIPSIRSHAGTGLVAVCGLDTDRTAAFAAKHGIANAYTDHKAMLAAGGLDAVIVSTPDDSHKVITLAAISAGLHVLCEKPLALNAPDAVDMLGAAEAKGVKHLVHFTWRWTPPFQYLKALLDEGTIGKPYRAQFTFLVGGGYDPSYQWRLDGGRANGVLADLGAHLIDLGHWLIGTVARVSAHTPAMMSRKASDGRPLKPVNHTAHLVLEYLNGVQGTVDVSTLAHLGEHGVYIGARIDGDAGSIEVDYEPISPTHQMDVRIVKAGVPERRLAAIPGQHLPKGDTADMMAVFTQKSVGTRLFLDSIADNTRPEPGFEAGVAAQRVIDAALRSDAERRWVDV